MFVGVILGKIWSGVVEGQCNDMGMGGQGLG